MPPKKKDVVFKTTTKNNLPLYFDRYKEIEIYLRLLQEPHLVGNLLQAIPVGANAAAERVEQELKTFLEHKFQVLTGLVQENVVSSLDKDELTVLKLLASKMVPKTNPATFVPSDSDQANTEENNEDILPTPVQVQSVLEVNDEPFTQEEPDDNDVLVSVTDVNSNKILKKRAKEAKKIVKETEVPVVEGPTDRMKISRPKGAAPRQKASPAEEMAMASMAANASAQAFSSLSDGRATMVAQPMAQPSMESPVLNLDESFSMYR